MALSQSILDATELRLTDSSSSAAKIPCATVIQALYCDKHTIVTGLQTLGTTNYVNPKDDRSQYAWLVPKRVPQFKQFFRTNCIGQYHKRRIPRSARSGVQKPRLLESISVNFCQQSGIVMTRHRPDSLPHHHRDRSGESRMQFPRCLERCVDLCTDEGRWLVKAREQGTSFVYCLFLWVFMLWWLVLSSPASAKRCRIGSSYLVLDSSSPGPLLCNAVYTILFFDETTLAVFGLPVVLLHLLRHTSSLK